MRGTCSVLASAFSLLQAVTRRRLRDWVSGGDIDLQNHEETVRYDKTSFYHKIYYFSTSFIISCLFPWTIRRGPRCTSTLQLYIYIFLWKFTSAAGIIHWKNLDFLAPIHASSSIASLPEQTVALFMCPNQLRHSRRFNSPETSSNQARKRSTLLWSIIIQAGRNYGS